ncbi:OprD family porin [Pseudomonas fluorescens]|uniref:Porin-like protein NicP n=1 Tax=Pseudomonas fluorescens TaxID=294 RepID=A0A5E7DEU8_PSEFL|nr:OprD family porin [Pseudomonas fluorescens]VVO12318.1 Porin-like protein NicP [Pseudomonas fluorescens]
MKASVRLGTLGSLLTIAIVPAVKADALEDSHLSLGLRNFYVDRDFKQNNAPQSRVGSWSQGFDLQFRSGYTDGPVQFGLDAAGQFAYRLDGGGGRATDTVLPYDKSSGNPVRDYGRAGLTAKVRMSNTEVRVGEQRPTLPVAYMDDSRQLVTTFEGATIESREWSRLTLNAGRFWKISTRESSNREDIYLFGDSPAQSSDGLNFAGARYDFTPALNATYYFGQLEDIYRQHYLGLAYTLSFGDGYSLKNDVRYYNNREEGKQLSGDLDNRSLGLMTALKKGGHTYTLAYQRMFGDDAFPLLNGYAPQPYLVNWSTIAFYKASERSWQARYDYDFAALGVPGLKFMTRYLRGVDINRGANLADNVESERNFVMSYVVQSGPLQGLGFEGRNIKVKTRYGADFDENRLITTYTWKFW